MSGRKYTTVTVRQDELNDLRQKARELSKVRQDLPQIIESNIRIAERNAELRIRPILQRQQEYQRALEKSSEHIRKIEMETARKIESQAAKAAAENERIKREFQGELDIVKKEQVKQNEQVQARIDDIAQRSDQQAKILKDEINQERKARREADAQIQQQIDVIKADQERSRVLAAECINDSKVIADFIRGHYQHEKFLPGELERIEQQLNSAIRILNQNIPDAALATAVMSVNDLSSLRIRLEEMEAEWNQLRSQVIEIAKALLDAINQSKSVPQIEDKTSEISESDYWARGKLAELEAKIQSILSEVERDGTNLTTPQLKELTEALPREQDSLEAINQAVQESVLRSQMRVNILDAAMARLIEENGFAPDGATYVGEDPREGVVGHVGNLAGDKVVITIESKEDGECVIVDSIETTPRSRQEHISQMEGISNSLRRAGYDVATPVIASDQPSSENKDLEEVRKRKPSEKPSQIPAPSSQKVVKPQAKTP